MLVVLFLVSIVSAEIVSISPETLEPISIYSGETITKNITIHTAGNYLIYLDYNITNNTHNEEGLSINLPQWIFVEEEKIFEVEISTVPLFMPDSFTINFNIFTNKVEVKNTSLNNYNETTEEIDTGMGLVLEIESDGNGTVEVYKVTEDLEDGFSIPSLNLFFHIEASDSIIDGMNETEIKVSYTDAEVNALGIDENNLRLYFYNETLKRWKVRNSWVDTTNNIVYGVTDHFSLWGVFGNLIPDTSTSSKQDTKRIWYVKTVNNTITETCDDELYGTNDTEEIKDEETITLTPEEINWPMYIIISVIVILIGGCLLYCFYFKRLDNDVTPVE